MEVPFDNDFDNVVKEITTLKEHYKETTALGKDLKQVVTLLKEEIQTTRDQEKMAQSQRKTSLAFISQQQEVIGNLLNVKEENEHLKLTLKHLESEVKQLQKAGSEEQMKFIAELEKVKHEHFSELTQIKENADEETSTEDVARLLRNASASKMLEVKHRVEVNVSELMSQLEFIKKEKHDEMVRVMLEHNEEVKKLNNTIGSLQSEIKELKERSAANISVFQKKLADQERYYLGEIEVWKQAELNQMTMRYEQPVRCQEQSAPVQAQATPSAFRTPLNIVSILKRPKTNTYQTANQFYQVQQDQRQKQQQLREQQQRLQQQQLQQQLEQQHQQLLLQQQQLEEQQQQQEIDQWRHQQEQEQQQQQQQQKQKQKQQQQQQQQQHQQPQQQLREDENSIQQHLDNADSNVHDQVPTVTKSKIKFPIVGRKRKLYSRDTDF